MNTIDFYPSMRLNMEEINKFEEIRKNIINKKYNKDTLGWLDLPCMPIEEVKKIKYYANIAREQSDILLVVGIGGSYVGAKAAIEFINGSMYYYKNNKKESIFFAVEMLKYIEG